MPPPLFVSLRQAQNDKERERHHVIQLLQTCKPDFVLVRRSFSEGGQVAIIYLSRQLPGGINLPTLQPSSCRQKDRTSRPQRLVYVAFQHARFTR
jgi:hypothetical protein